MPWATQRRFVIEHKLAVRFQRHAASVLCDHVAPSAAAAAADTARCRPTTTATEAATAVAIAMPVDAPPRTAGCMARCHGTRRR